MRATFTDDDGREWEAHGAPLGAARRGLQAPEEGVPKV